MTRGVARSSTRPLDLRVGILIALFLLPLSLALPALDRTTSAPLPPGSGSPAPNPRRTSSYKPLRQISLEFAEALVDQQGFTTPPQVTGEKVKVLAEMAEKEKEMELAKPKEEFHVFSAANIAILLVFITTASFLQVKFAASAGTVSAPRDSNYILGLGAACLALVGNAMVGALRKILSQHNVGSAQQVGIATLIQGIFAIAYCLYSGDLAMESTEDFISHLPGKPFWIAAVGASVLNGIVKTLETKAFSETDISLCAPFLAFDPVMQFVVGVAVMPLACKLMDFGCDEAKSTYPAYHVLSVACIAFGAFLLGKGTASGGKVSASMAKAKYLGPLPVGSWYILLNCVIYGFTSRMDKVAIKSAGKTLYYAYGRLLMAASTLGGAFMSGALTWRELKKFCTPSVMSLLAGICVADAVYMLSLYQAFAWISPVYVTAIKRGGGILLSSLLGVVLFGESMAGRFGPILTICLGVTYLCQ